MGVPLRKTLSTDYAEVRQITSTAAAHFRYGIQYLMPVGRSDEAIAEAKRALELEVGQFELAGAAVLQNRAR